MTGLEEPAVRTARIALVGAGWWATHSHLPALVADERVRLVGVADPDDANRAHAAERFAPEATFADIGELLRVTRPDGVVISTPHVHHGALGTLAVEAGAHVMIEKPMVVDPEDGARLVLAAQRARREIVVGYPWHYSPQALDLRRRLADGVVGEIQCTSCLFSSSALELYVGEDTPQLASFAILPQRTTYASARLGGGQLQTQLSHAAALLLFVTRLRVRRVAAFGSSLGLDVDVVDGAAASFDNGAVGTFTTTGTAPPGTSQLEYRIFGDRGVVVWDVRRDEVTITSTDGRVERLDPPGPDESYPRYAPIGNLVDIILAGAANGSPPDVGLHTAELLAAIAESAAHDGAPTDLHRP